MSERFKDRPMRIRMKKPHFMAGNTYELNTGEDKKVYDIPPFNHERTLIGTIHTGEYGSTDHRSPGCMNWGYLQENPNLWEIVQA